MNGRRRTRFTLPLQVIIAAYLLIELVSGYLIVADPISTSIRSGRVGEAMTFVVIALVATAITGALVYGALTRRSWAFWATLLILLVGVVISFRGGTSHSYIDLATSVLNVALFAICAAALIRYGPWAMARDS